MPQAMKIPDAKAAVEKNGIGPVLNTKVCFHDERYSIEVQVRIVNGVDKYVTESMPTAKEEDIASGNPLLKQDQDRSPQ